MDTSAFSFFFSLFTLIFYRLSQESVFEIVLYEFILRPIEQASYLGSTRSNIVAEGEIRFETDILMPLGEDDRSIIVLYESKEEDETPLGFPCHFALTGLCRSLKNRSHYVFIYEHSTTRSWKNNMNQFRYIHKFIK